MARSPVNIEDLDVERLGDQELHAMLSRIQGALHGRFTTRTQEFRELAREMGFAVTLTKLGRETSPSVPMTMRHRPPASLDLGTGDRHRGYAQHRWPNRREECCWQ